MHSPEYPDRTGATSKLWTSQRHRHDRKSAIKSSKKT